MRFLLLIVDDLHPSSESKGRYIALSRAWLPKGASLDVEPVEIGPPVFFESALGMSLAVPGIVKKLLDIEHRYDAVILGGFADPGLTVAREVADFPIVGPGEACVHFACLLGTRFGIVTLMESNIPVIEANVNAAGLRSRCSAIRAIEMPVKSLRDNPQHTINRIVAAGERVLESGADVVILGCFAFASLEATSSMSHKLGVPVVDPFYVSLKTAEALVIGGYRSSRKTYPGPDVIQLRDFNWLSSSYPSKTPSDD